MAGDDTDDVLYRAVGDVGTIVINRPMRRNSLTLAAWSRIHSFTDRFNQDSALKVLIIRGAGEEAFAAGSDIYELPRVYADAATSAEYDRTLLGAQNAIASSPKPTLAMVFGHCVGGGLGIATACDLRFAASNANFALPPAKLGLINGVSSMKRLIRLIGVSACRDMIYSARPVDASEALRLGLVNRVVAPDELVATTEAYAESIAANSQYTIRVSKSLTEKIADELIDDDERYWALVREAAQGNDFAEGFAAFKQKRAPKFPKR